MTASSSDIVIIGSGPAGIATALSTDKSTLLLEKDEKPLKRILVSGNGRCNFFNEDLFSPSLYQDEELKNIIFYNGENRAKEAFSFLFESKDFAYRKEGKLYYPYFNKSECVKNFFLDELKKKQFTIRQGRVVKIDLKKKTLFLADESKVHYEKLVIAVGALSYDRKREDLAFLEDLKAEVEPFKSSLCPLVVKEKMPRSLDKNRLKCTVEASYSNQVFFQEEGEVIFKRDGLSGICIFNLSLAINELKRRGVNHEIKIDLIFKGKERIALSAYPSFLFTALKSPAQDRLTFTYLKHYDFSASQASYGGILLSELNPFDLSLKKHPDIHLAGEVLDQNAPCGGYNIGLALIEGYIVGKSL